MTPADACDPIRAVGSSPLACCAHIPHVFDSANVRRLLLAQLLLLSGNPALKLADVVSRTLDRSLKSVINRLVVSGQREASSATAKTHLDLTSLLVQRAKGLIYRILLLHHFVDVLVDSGQLGLEGSTGRSVS